MGNIVLFAAAANQRVCFFALPQRLLRLTAVILSGARPSVGLNSSLATGQKQRRHGVLVQEGSTKSPLCSCTARSAHLDPY